MIVYRLVRILIIIMGNLEINVLKKVLLLKINDEIYN